MQIEPKEAEESEAPSGRMTRDEVLACAVATAIYVALLWSIAQGVGDGLATRAVIALSLLWLVLGVLALRDERHGCTLRWDGCGRWGLIVSLLPTLWLTVFAVNDTARHPYTRPSYIGLDDETVEPEDPWLAALGIALSLLLAALSLRRKEARRRPWRWAPLAVAVLQAAFVAGLRSLPW